MTDSPRKRPAGLGRGLSSLLGEVQQEAPVRQRITSHADYELADTVYDHAGHPRVLRARRKA